MSAYLHRLARLEVLYQDRPCPTCRDWPALVILMPGDPDRPALCPKCGRDASHVVRFAVRHDGPQ